MAGVSKRSKTFFRISPAEQLNASYFGVEQGKVRQRADVNFWRITPFLEERFSYATFAPVQFGELALTIQYGSSDLAKLDPPGVPILRMNNLQDDGWDLSSLKYIELSERQLETYRLYSGDLIFNRTNSKELVGKCEVFNESGDWVFASYLIRVRTNEARLNPQFASDFLSTFTGRLQIDRFSRQIIGMTNINAEEIRQILIPLPPLQKQNELVAAMDEARSQRQQKLENSCQLIRSIDEFILDALEFKQIEQKKQSVFAVNNKSLINSRFDVFFFQPHLRIEESLASSYKDGTQELGSILDGEPINGIDSRNYLEHGRQYLRVKNIRPFEIKTDDIVFIEDDPKNEKILLLEDDILMTRKGTFGISAKVEKSHINCLISSEIILLRIKKNTWCNVDFLVAWLNSSLVQSVLNRHKAGAIMGHLTQGVIKQLPVPLVSFDLQLNIVAEIQRRRDESRRLESEAETGWKEAKRWFEEQLLGSDQT